MNAAIRVGSETLQEFRTVILAAVPASFVSILPALPPLALRVILHACILTGLLFGAHLLACELRVLLLSDGLKALLNIDLILHVALDVSCLIGLRKHHLHADWRNIHNGTCLSSKDSCNNLPVEHLQTRMFQLIFHRFFHPVDDDVDTGKDGI